MYSKNLFIFFIFLSGFILNVISVQIVSSSFKDLQGALGASIEQVDYEQKKLSVLRAWFDPTLEVNFH